MGRVLNCRREDSQLSEAANSAADCGCDTLSCSTSRLDFPGMMGRDLEL